MTTLVFCLEEPSAREMLQALLPRLLPPQVDARYIVFEGKQDLHRRLKKRLREWQAPDSKFVILRDQDNADCHAVKQELEQICRESGRADALVRVACRELESWYLGDLAAVEQGLHFNGLARRQHQAKYRQPDRLGNPAEEIGKLTRNTYQKISGSRAIGGCLSPHANQSHSFQVFLSGLRRLVESIP